MPYIGKNPTSGGFHKLDSLTASATATYALTLNSAAYFPESANQLLVSLNGVIQAPQDSFTVSSSNIVFDTALTADDSIDFIVALGDVHSVGTPTDGSITATKIGSDAVTTAKIADGAVTNAKIDTMAASKLTGALPAIDGSALTGVGVSVARVSEIISSGHAGGFTAGAWRTRALNTEEFDPDGIVTLSSNQFTLGAGKYLCHFNALAFKVARHTTKIYNITDSSDVIKGTNAYASSALDVNTESSGFAFINITGSKVFELQHYATTTKATNGLGSGSTTADQIPNTFSSVTIIKVG
jgi:hypothetical protein